jgi:hypothetical protein
VVCGKSLLEVAGYRDEDTTAFGGVTAFVGIAGTAFCDLAAEKIVSAFDEISILRNRSLQPVMKLLRGGGVSSIVLVYESASPNPSSILQSRDIIQKILTDENDRLRPDMGRRRREKKRALKSGICEFAKYIHYRVAVQSFASFAELQSTIRSDTFTASVVSEDDDEVVYLVPVALLEDISVPSVCPDEPALPELVEGKIKID